jgi:CDP-paratose 2-epimerase
MTEENKMKVLVTGGCGFLGSNLVAHYLAMDAEVVVIDALFRKGSELNLKWLKEDFQNKSLSFYCKDLAEYPYVEEVFKKHAPFDYICHLGGQVAMTTSLSDPRRDMLTNVVGTFNVLEAMRKYSPDALLAYSSTNKVYGDLEHIKIIETPTRYVMPDHPNGLDEQIPLDFASPYGCSKGAADQYVRDWCRNFGLKTVVFRHSSIYGGRQFATFDQGWVGWFCQKALEQKMAYDRGSIPECFTISGSGKQVRDVLHAEDLIRLYHLAWERRDCVAGEIFNIGGGLNNSLSLLELFDILEKLLGFGEGQYLLYEKLPRRQSDQDVFVADIAKASKLILWSPQVDKQDGILKMISWTKDSIC